MQQRLAGQNSEDNGWRQAALRIGFPTLYALLFPSMRQRSLAASEWAETDATTATGTPSAPVLTLVGVIANSVIINWEPASCAEEHAIYCNATDITQYSMPLGTVAVDATLIYTDNFEVEHEPKYYYFVIPQRIVPR